MYDLQIAFNGNGPKVDNGAIGSAPDKIFAEYYYTQPVAEVSRQADITEPQGVNKSDKEAAEKIECVLVDNQRVLLVLFRRDKSVQNERVASHSHDAHERYSQLEVEFGIK